MVNSKERLDVRELLSKMSLEEKAGQIFVGDFVGKYEMNESVINAVENGKIGTILYFSGCNVQDSVQLKDLTSQLQKLALSSKHNVPLFVCIDQEGGQLAPIFRKINISPGNMALGAIPKSESENAAFEVGRITGEQLKSIGINVNFAPVIDTAYDRNYKIVDNRYFSSDPEIVKRNGLAMIKGIQSTGIMACTKHFPGQRIIDIDSHHKLDRIPFDRARLDKVEFYPFKEAASIGVGGMMTLHAIFEAIDKEDPATLSHAVLTGLLRQELGFEGIIFTDDLQMKPIVKGYGLENAIIKAFNAGADQIMISMEYREGYKVLSDAVKSGAVSEERLNESVERILKHKQQYIELPIKENTDAEVLSVVVSESSKRIYTEISEKSVTLVKHQNNILPLKVKPRERITIIRPSWVRLVMSDNTNFYRYNLLDHIKKYHDNVEEIILGAQPEEWERLSAGDWAFISDVVIYCTIDGFRYPLQFQMIKENLIHCGVSVGAEHAIYKDYSNRKWIGVALRSPEDVELFPDRMDAVLATYSVTDSSLEALTKVLFGDAPPMGELPAYISDRYPLGHGIKGY